MANAKTELLINPIMNYIKRLVSKFGAQPQLLPTEMELCEKFHVSRGTVRRAMTNLISAGFVIQLPNRRRYFSNPDTAVQCFLRIGVLVGDGRIAGMGEWSAITFSTFAKELRLKSSNAYEFITLSGATPEECAGELVNCGFDGLLWIAPPEKCVPIIDRLLEQEIPLVAVENICLEIQTPPAYNFFAYDFAYSGECHAEGVFNTGCSKILQCSEHIEMSRRFGEVLREHGIAFDSSRICRDLTSLPAWLNFYLDRDDVDFIACDGGVLRYNTVFSTVAAHPNGKNVILQIERETQACAVRKKFPQLRFLELDTFDMAKASEHAGKMAGALLYNILTKRKPLKNGIEKYR